MEELYKINMVIKSVDHKASKKPVEVLDELSELLKEHYQIEVANADKIKNN